MQNIILNIDYMHWLTDYKIFGHKFQNRKKISVILWVILFHFKVFLQLKPTIKQNTMLLVRLDLIGDYILFRNFIEIIRKSQKYSNYRIVFCGNIIYRDLAESLEASFIDEFIHCCPNITRINSIGYRFPNRYPEHQYL